MPLLLPPIDHPARDLFDEDFAALLNSQDNLAQLPRLLPAISAARTYIQRESGVNSVNVLVHSLCDILLVQVFKDDLTVLWNFGTYIKVASTSPVSA